MDRFDVPHHRTAHSHPTAEPMPSEALLSDGMLEAAAFQMDSSVKANVLAPEGRAEGMEWQVEGLQAVLQDSSTALQQELMSAEARMEVLSP